MKKETTTEQMLIPLPYEPIKIAANRQTAWDNSVKRGKETLFVNINKIITRTLFNGRKAPEAEKIEKWKIEELAANIAANGLEFPIKGVFDTDGNFVLMDGERRLLAIKYNVSKGINYADGSEMNIVEVSLKNKEITEDALILSMLNSNDNLKYEPVELAEMILRLKKSFGYSHEKIAKSLGKSRQYIDNLISLGEEPESIKEAVASGALGATAANELKRNVPDKEKREEIVKKAVASGENIKVNDAKAMKKEKDEKSFIPGGFQQMDEKAPIRHETKESLKAEEESHKTSAKPPVHTPKTQKDALGKVDWSADKTEAELELNEVITMLDKLEVKFDHFPANMKQTATDCASLTNFIRMKALNVQKLIKKAPSRGDDDLLGE